MSARDFSVEKDWTTSAGFRAVVIMGSLGHRCGYVAVPPAHPLYGLDYSAESAAVLPISDDEEVGSRGVIPIFLAALGGSKERLDVVFNVHGSLTYAGGSGTYPVDANGLWWFGFDCGHAGDAPSDEYLAKQRERYPDQSFMWERDCGQTHRSLEYCVAECESLASQFISRVRPASAPEAA
jgi:hypothetical protein